MMEIRPAQPDDAEVAAVLLFSAYTYTQVTFPLGDTAAPEWIERLQLLFRQAGNRFSYQNCLVAVDGGAVAGLVLSFAGGDEPRLNAAVGSWLESEAAADEWYVDALAVLSTWSRQGIGARLLQHTEQAARARHYSKIALNVAEDNRPARALYGQRHYLVTRQTVLYGQAYVRMVKTLAEE